MKTRLLITIVLNCIAFLSIAQDKEKVELIGDRPDQTESAYILPKGYFQLEDGFIYENENERVRNISYSSLLLRYGLFENFELRFAADYVKIDRTSFDNETGFTPFSLGAKIHVNKEKGWIPQMAFLGHINIKNTGSGYYHQNHLSPHMALTFSHSINDFWSVGYSLGIDFPLDKEYTVRYLYSGKRIYVK